MSSKRGPHVQFDLPDNDQAVIRKMESVLKENDIPSHFYCIGRYAEESVCLERSAGGWTVYNGERGNRYDLVEYEKLTDACAQVINRTAESDEQYEKMNAEFRSMVSAKPVLVSRVDTKAKVSEFIKNKQTVPKPLKKYAVIWDKLNLKDDLPRMKIGDTVRVITNVKVGKRERPQTFEGVVVAKKMSGADATFTVRRGAYGVVTEKVFSLDSPSVVAVETVRRGKAGRAKMNYWKAGTGKVGKVKYADKHFVGAGYSDRRGGKDGT